MIKPDHELSIKRHAELLNIARGSAYDVPRPVSDADQALMRSIDALHLEHPFAGARMLRDLLRREDFEVGRKHVATLMAKMSALGACVRKLVHLCFGVLKSGKDYAPPDERNAATA